MIRTPTTDFVPAVAAARAGREVVACSAGPDLPGTVGGLGMTCDLTSTAPPRRSYLTFRPRPMRCR
ncbi:hypothetical protein ACWEO2_30385 [Nocardia sp. NPDC004278]